MATDQAHDGVRCMVCRAPWQTDAGGAYRQACGCRWEDGVRMMMDLPVRTPAMGLREVDAEIRESQRRSELRRQERRRESILESVRLLFVAVLLLAVFYVWVWFAWAAFG